MKIAGLLLGDSLSGGGFNQALNALLQMQRLCRDRHEFVVYTNLRENLPVLQDLRLDGKFFSPGWRDKLAYLGNTNKLVARIHRVLKIPGSLESAMNVDKVDIVYFTSPSPLSLSLQKLNVIATLWDLCHRDTPEFPEVRRMSEFHAREKLYRQTLPPAVLVLTDSEVLCERSARRYGIDRDKLLAMPFAPSPLMRDASSEARENVMAIYALEEGYLFYPAQFWPHKNHVRVLQALAYLKNNGELPRVVFAGGDKGNLGYVKRKASQLGVAGQVRFLGFVPGNHMLGLYEGCSAVVMPSYFGPTNLPPLEAWQFGKPLLYANLYKEQAGDAAVYFDPDDAKSLAEAIESVGDPEVTSELVERGTRRLRAIDEQRRISEQALLQRLEVFAKRRECWE